MNFNANLVLRPRHLIVWQAAMMVAVLLSLSGCGNNAAAMRNDLKQAGLAYHMCHDTKQHGPENWEDLKSAGLDSQTAARLQAAGYEFKWGVKFSELTAGTSATVMAESKTSPYKLMMDGSVSQ